MPKPRGFSSEFGFGFDRGSYTYALVPYVWNSVRPRWVRPSQAVAALDLRPLPAQGISGGAPQGFAFTACLQSPGGTTVATVPHLSEADTTTMMRDAWESAMGFRPAGAKLVDLLFDQLTLGADPTGDAGPKPLMPTSEGFLEIRLAGHSIVKQETFRYGVHPHTNRVAAVLRRDFQILWEATNGHDHCRRVLDATCIKYRVDDWKEFVPRELHAHVPGRLPHQTTITETWPTNSTTLSSGQDHAWTEVSGGWEVISGRCTKSSGLNNQIHRCRCDTVLSTDDHYHQAVLQFPASGSRYHGPACRVDSGTTDTFYLHVFGSPGDNNAYLDKMVSGTQTGLDSAAHTASDGQLAKIQADGSSITGSMAGSEINSATDTAITGLVHIALDQYQPESGEGLFDTTEAADLAVAAATIPPKPTIANFAPTRSFSY